MNVAVITGFAFLAMGALILCSNWYHAVAAYFLKNSTSFTLLIGGSFGMLGILLTPIPNFYFWLPLVADFTFPLIAYHFFRNRNAGNDSPEV